MRHRYSKECLEYIASQLSAILHEWETDGGPIHLSSQDFLGACRTLTKRARWKSGIAYARITSSGYALKCVEHHLEPVGRLLSRIEFEIIEGVEETLRSGDLNNDIWAEKEFQPKIKMHVLNILEQAKLVAALLDYDDWWYV